MNKIRIMTCVEGRLDIVAGFLMQIEYLREKSGFALPLTIAASEDEDIDFITEHSAWNESCGIIQTPNNPLSEKHNKMLQGAMREKDWDILIHLGSDDLVSLEYILKASELEIEPNTIYGVNELYFYNAAQMRMKRFTYSGIRLIGAGRIFPRKVLEATKGKKVKYRRPYFGWLSGEEQYVPDALLKTLLERSVAEPVSRSKKKHTLWTDKKNSGLDNASSRILDEMGIKQVNISEEFDFPQIIDIKTHQSITPWQRITAPTLTEKQAQDVFDRITPTLTFER